jgi:hypothetical protein
VWEVGPGQETNGCDYSCSHIYKELSTLSGIGNTYRDIFLLSEHEERKERSLALLWIVSPCVLFLGSITAQT